MLLATVDSNPAPRTLAGGRPPERALAFPDVTPPPPPASPPRPATPPPSVLTCTTPVLTLSWLLSCAPLQFTDCDEHNVRNVVLEILNRLPNNERLRPYVSNLMKTVRTNPRCFGGPPAGRDLRIGTSLTPSLHP
jgi:hypothetical protein